MTGRKNAMLTTEDRRWLTGEKRYEDEHAKQRRYQRRRDIRKRVYNSSLDFSILFEHLEADEREKVFGTPTTNQASLTDDRELTNGVRDGLAFLLYSTGSTSSMDADDGPEPIAERLLTEALRRAGRKDGILVESADLDIEAVALSRLTSGRPGSGNGTVATGTPGTARNRRRRFPCRPGTHPRTGVRRCVSGHAELPHPGTEQPQNREPVPRLRGETIHDDYDPR